jgi:hypothetical protein
MSPLSAAGSRAARVAAVKLEIRNSKLEKNLKSKRESKLQASKNQTEAGEEETQMPPPPHNDHDSDFPLVFLLRLF